MKNKIQYFENLRVIAIFGVILSHVVVALSQKIQPTGIDVAWWITNIIQTGCRFVVPVLIMESGALLLGSKHLGSIKEFLSKRFSKIFIPFLTWNVIYAYISSGTSKKIFFQTLLHSIQGPIFYHLWFLYAIFGLYLITPVLWIYVKNASLNNIKYFLILWLFVTGLNPLLKLITGVSLGIELYYFSGFIGYYVLGYYLTKIELSKNSIFLLGLSLFISYTVALSLTFILSNHSTALISHKTVLFFQDFPSITVIIMSAAVFILSRYSALMNSIDLSLKGKVNIGRICYGVFLSHALVLSTLSYRFGIFAKPSNLLASIFLTTILTIIICFGFFIILDLFAQKNKIINNISKLIF